MNLIDVRANLLGASDVLSEAALDKYSFVRNAYLQRREYLISGGESTAPDYGETPSPTYDESGTGTPAAAAATGRVGDSHAAGSGIGDRCAGNRGVGCGRRVRHGGSADPGKRYQHDSGQPVRAAARTRVPFDPLTLIHRRLTSGNIFDRYYDGLA